MVTNWLWFLAGMALATLCLIPIYKAQQYHLNWLDNRMNWWYCEYCEMRDRYLAALRPTPTTQGGKPEEATDAKTDG